jgi:hypothetical protein
MRLPMMRLPIKKITVVNDVHLPPFWKSRCFCSFVACRFKVPLRTHGLQTDALGTSAPLCGSIGHAVKRNAISLPANSVPDGWA